MKKEFEQLPQLPENPSGHVGIIGCGNFAFSNIAFYLWRNNGRVMRGAMDTNIHRAASLAQHYRLNYFTDDADRIVFDPDIDLVYIASNHATHADYAIAALAQGKAVHIEKPHVVSADQLERLCSAIVKHNGRVATGFNRPQSRIGRMIFDALASQTGSAILNWFIAGHAIEPDHWYFHEQEGGRILGNLCHWTDFVFQMIAYQDRFPITITPTRADRSDCDIAVTFTFGNGTIAAITFSAKGHTFEGVRESFAAHRGNVLISMTDFHNLDIEIFDRKQRHRPWFRDHGHETAISRSYSMVEGGRAEFPGETVRYIWETGLLFLKTRESLERRQTIVLDGREFERSGIAGKAVS